MKMLDFRHYIIIDNMGKTFVFILILFVVAAIIYWGAVKEKPILPIQQTVSSSQEQSYSIPHGWKEGEAIYLGPLQLELKLNSDRGENSAEVSVASKVSEVLKKSVAFEWKVNGDVKSRSNSVSGLKRGDKVTVTISSSQEDKLLLSRTLAFEAKNAAPVISGHKVMTSNDKIVEVQLIASDLDGDPLTFELIAPLPAMTVDNGGVFRWTVSVKDRPESAVAKIVAKDGQGGTYTYELRLQ